MPKIIILDGYAANPGDLSWEPLKEYGELTVYDRTSAEDIIPRIAGADYIYTNKVPLSKEAIDSVPNLKWIGVLATGYNIVDIQHAKEKGIPVTNIPAYSSAAVAQNVFALLLHICHHAGEHAAAVSRGKWSEAPDFCFWDYPQIELDHKIMGLVGFGDIGKRVANIAQALGMKVFVNTPHPISSMASNALSFVNFDSLIEQSDVVSLHCPLTYATENLIDRTVLSRMKSNSILINTGRGPLIAEQDLAEALNSGQIYAAGLDVLRREPPEMSNPLFTARNCFITPHVSWSSYEARVRLLNTAVENLKAYRSGNPINVVNV